MKKTATFSDKDNELIQEITEYQKRKNLRSFVDAVRELCQTALQFQDIVKKSK